MSFYNFYNTNVTPKHKTFISFHHADDYYKKHLETQWGEQFDGFVSRSVGDVDINPYLPTDRIRQFQRHKTCLLINRLDSYRTEAQAHWRD